jgi:hypothetical protein
VNTWGWGGRSMGERKKYDQVFCLHFILFSSIYREKKYEVEKKCGR